MTVASESVLDDDSWRKLTGEPPEKTSNFCDQLARELRRLEAELEARNGAAREPRDLLCSTTLELLKAAAQAAEAARTERAEDAAALRLEVEQVSRAGKADEAPPERKAEEVEELRRELERERTMHDEALRKLHTLQQRGDEEVAELQEELALVGAALEEKEEDMLSIQFEMVSLQNRLCEEERLIASSAEALQRASEELADKDKQLQEATDRQRELAQQLEEVSERLQDGASRLLEELDASRSAYRSLEARALHEVSHLQLERDALRAELERARSPEELQERLLSAEAEIGELRCAVEGGRLRERQASERAQEYRTSLELYREFGAEVFGPSPVCSPPGGSPTSFKPEEEDDDERRLSSDGAGEVALPRVLMAVELNLGCAGTATLSVAPWQTRSDFDGVVADFLREHRIKAIFAGALIRYLEEVEETAESFPTRVQANLSEIYSSYG
mmetsp:Transcript_81665/g.236744  ORF Transcript_81665/g.236744 Transcript_81665/m.236744 type:complete len:449 (+) Transcript_81665:83-1429(+)